MSRFFPRIVETSARAMVFVDGENLAVRYGAMLRSKATDPPPHVSYEPDVLVWSSSFNKVCVHGGVVRKHYYTSVSGDDRLLAEIQEKLKLVGIEAPRVFKKVKGRRSKRVDISLATDMLTHAFRKNYDIAVLVAGDEDYVPLVEAVMREGRRVLLWFVEDGLSPVLRRTADHYADIGEVLFAEKVSPALR